MPEDCLAYHEIVFVFCRVFINVFADKFRGYILICKKLLSLLDQIFRKINSRVGASPGHGREEQQSQKTVSASAVQYGNGLLDIPYL